MWNVRCMASVKFATLSQHFYPTLARPCTMSLDDLRKDAVNAVGRILPLDFAICAEMVDYTLTLPQDQIEGHLLDLLGHSDESYEFISKFTELKNKTALSQKNQPEKAKPKPAKSERVPKCDPGASTETERTTSRTRLQNNTTSVTVSQLSSLKPSSQLSNAEAKKTKKKNLDSLKDINAVLREVEEAKMLAETDLTNSLTVRRVCNCMTTKHALFEVAPNCLNCGKIICTKEGLQPCSFCGKELLSEHEKTEIIRILQQEKNLLQLKLANPKEKLIQQQTIKPQKHIKFPNAMSGNLWKAQEEAFKLVEEEKKRRREQEEQEAQQKRDIEDQKRELELYKRKHNVNKALLTAQERLEMLLHYQETGAERNKIIDNAADFEIPSVSCGSMWLSPMERVLQLMKQQKQLRTLEAVGKAREGRSNRVVEMVIRDGSVKMVEKVVNMSDEGQRDIEQLEKEIHQEKLAQEQALFKNVWDYESELNKWQKPVYVGDRGAADTSVNEDSVKILNRVQHDNLDSDDLVALMAS